MVKRKMTGTTLEIPQRKGGGTGLPLDLPMTIYMYM